MHSKKSRERIANVTLKGVYSRFQVDPMFIGEQKLSIITSRIPLDKSVNVQKEQLELDTKRFLEVKANLNLITRLWIHGSMKKFDLYQKLYQKY